MKKSVFFTSLLILISLVSFSQTYEYKIVTCVALLLVVAVNRTFGAGEFDVLLFEERFHLGFGEV